MDLLIWVIIFLISAILILIFAFCKLAGQLDEQDLTNEMSLKKLEQAQAYSAELLRNNVKLTGQLQAEQKRADDYKEKAEILQAAHERLVTVPVYDLDELTEEAETEPIKEEAVEQFAEPLSKERLPEGIDTNMFFCEDYRLLNVKNSEQWLLQLECDTELESGLRYYTANDKRYYCAALGNAYDMNIGDTWHVTLQNGYEFDIIRSDFKHPITTQDPYDFGDRYDTNGNQFTNYDIEPVINVIEFVYDKQIAPKGMLKAGTMSYFERFGGLKGDGGNITKIEYTGRVWK